MTTFYSDATTSLSTLKSVSPEQSLKHPVVNTPVDPLIVSPIKAEIESMKGSREVHAPPSAPPSTSPEEINKNMLSRYGGK